MQNSHLELSVDNPGGTGNDFAKLGSVEHVESTMHLDKAGNIMECFNLSSSNFANRSFKASVRT